MTNLTLIRPAVPSPVLATRRLATRRLATRRLAVFGWSPETRAALAALEACGAYEGVGVADASGMALVQARTATHLPCHQQSLAFLQHTAYDALLIGSEDPDDAIEAIRLARSRGAQVLIAPDASHPETLAAASESTDGTPDGDAAYLLQPILQEAGFPELVQLLSASPAHTPRYLTTTVETATDPARLMVSAIAQLVALTRPAEATVTVGSWGAPDRALHVAVDTAEWHARLDVRHAPTPFMREASEAAGLAFDWRVTEDGPYLAHTDADGTRVAFRPAQVDHWATEAQRIATQGSDDRDAIRRQALLLDAVMRATTSGDQQRAGCCEPTVDTAPTMSSVRVDRESAQAMARSHLRLVTR